MPQRMVEDSEYFDFKASQYMRRLMLSPAMNEERRGPISRSDIIEKILERLDTHQTLDLVKTINESQIEKIEYTALTYSRDLANQLDKLMDIQSPDQYRVWLTAMLGEVEVLEPQGISMFQNRLAQIQSCLGLSSLETEFVNFAYLSTRRYGPMESLTSSRIYGYDAVFRSLHIILEIPETELASLLRVDSSLTKAGVVKAFRPGRNVELSDIMMEYLSGWRSSDVVESMFDVVRKPLSMDLSDFVLKPIQRDILSSLLAQKGRSVNILLHGESGMGKSTLAACLGAHLGLPMYGIRSVNGQDPEERMDQVSLAAAMFRSQDVILLVDEADTLLAASDRWIGKGAVQKSFLNTILESLPIKIIWISNDVEELPKSAIRRFDYVLNFEKLPRAARVIAWNKAVSICKDRVSFENSEIEQLADRWRLSPGVVARSMQNLAAIGTLGDAKPLSVIHELMSGYEGLLGGTPTWSNSSHTGPYFPLVLDTSGHLESALESARAFVSKGIPAECMALLLFGPSGSGKTRFAQYMAEQLNRRFIVRKAADLIAPVAGMSEKLISAVFKEAEDEEAVLFIDDCDVLLHVNSKSAQKWEISVLNAFVRQMESFCGLVICAVSNLSGMNRTPLRYFHLKVPFHTLNNDGKTFFYKMLLFPLTKDRKQFDEVVNELGKMRNLTAGDFQTVRRRFAHTADVSHGIMLKALSEENDLKMVSPVQMGF